MTQSRALVALADRTGSRAHTRQIRSSAPLLAQLAQRAEGRRPANGEIESRLHAIHEAYRAQRPAEQHNGRVLAVA